MPLSRSFFGYRIFPPRRKFFYAVPLPIGAMRACGARNMEGNVVLSECSRGARPRCVARRHMAQHMAQKSPAIQKRGLKSARGGTRTLTAVLPYEPESYVSTNFTTRAVNLSFSEKHFIRICQASMGKNRMFFAAARAAISAEDFSSPEAFAPAAGSMRQSQTAAKASISYRRKECRSRRRFSRG